MLTRLIQRTKAVTKDAVEYKYEYCDAEYEYDSKSKTNESAKRGHP